MDVNKPTGVQTVGDQPHRPPPERHEEAPERDEDDKARRERNNSWSADATVDLGGALAGGVTPEVQHILDDFAAQIEPLRAEVGLAKKREAYYREIALAHSFLPVPNRREFTRELKHVIDHIASLSLSAALVLAHVGNIGDLRRHHGRKAADAALCHVAKAIAAAIHPTDAVGSLCGEDFGIIVLNGEPDVLNARIAAIRNHVVSPAFSWPDWHAEIDLVFGTTVLQDGWTAEQAVDIADRDLMQS